MSVSDRLGFLGKGSAVILGAAMLIGLIHHADRVLRFDHSGWPFRASVKLFTFSLLAYPIALFAFLAQRDCSGCGGSFSWWAPASLFGRIS